MHSRDASEGITPSEAAALAKINISYLSDGDLISLIIETKKGNTEFALFRLREGDWLATIGNPTSTVMLGEAMGEFEADGKTSTEALRNLYALVTAKP